MGIVEISLGMDNRGGDMSSGKIPVDLSLEEKIDVKVTPPSSISFGGE